MKQQKSREGLSRNTAKILYGSLLRICTDHVRKTLVKLRNYVWTSLTNCESHDEAFNELFETVSDYSLTSRSYLSIFVLGVELVSQ
jgi:hypothetical protein